MRECASRVDRFPPACRARPGRSAFAGGLPRDIPRYRAACSFGKAGEIMDWNKMAAPWLAAESVLDAVHGQALSVLLERAALKSGQSVLDIGCGTGMSTVAAARAVEAGGRVTAIDIAPPLVARARDRVPDHVDLRTGDAGRDDLGGPHDAAIAQFGTMFFDDTAAAFGHIRAALRPGARFHFTAWGPPPENPWFTIPRAAVEARMGALPPPDPAAPGPFRFADRSVAADAAASAGWTIEPDTVSLALESGLPAGALAEAQLVIAEALMLADRDVTDGDRAAIRAGLEAGFTEHESDGVVSLPAVIHVFSAIA